MSSPHNPLRISSPLLGRLIQDPKRPHRDFLDPLLTPPDTSVTNPKSPSLPAIITAHDLQNPSSWFTNACAQHKTRSWLELTFDDRRDAYLVIGLLTATGVGTDSSSEGIVLAIRYCKVEFLWLDGSAPLEDNTRWRTDWQWRNLEDGEDEEVLEVRLGDEGVEVFAGTEEAGRLVVEWLHTAGVGEGDMDEGYGGRGQDALVSWRKTGKRKWDEVGGDGEAGVLEGMDARK